MCESDVRRRERTTFRAGLEHENGGTEERRPGGHRSVGVLGWAHRQSAQAGTEGVPAGGARAGEESAARGGCGDGGEVVGDSGGVA